jgi:hypothetical protein
MAQRHRGVWIPESEALGLIPSRDMATLREYFGVDSDMLPGFTSECLGTTPNLRGRFSKTSRPIRLSLHVTCLVINTTSIYFQIGRNPAAWASQSRRRTGVVQRSGLNYPFSSLQIVHLVEVSIPGNEHHTVMLRRGGNPDVVLG